MFGAGLASLEVRRSLVQAASDTIKALDRGEKAEANSQENRCFDDSHSESPEDVS